MRIKVPAINWTTALVTCGLAVGIFAAALVLVWRMLNPPPERNSHLDARRTMPEEHSTPDGE